MDNRSEHRYLKSAVIALWTLGVAIAGLVSGAAGTGWVTLAGVAVLPALIMLWFWTPPAVTTSERIHRARR
jgi:hypothetical protein